MEFNQQGYVRIQRLIDKGVIISNPLMLDLGEEVNLDNISGSGVAIFPGCRIHGEKTLIASGSLLGAEGPVVMENCQLGPGVELKGGYFREATFLEKASMGLGAQVREGCLLEEQAGGAHCVGLKQTILFPFVTLGSLINFCDCLMAGGTDRTHHSEVGSSYIHFNFTPEGDKTTASLIGDVPRGVMLNQPPIFLGGQGGMVGPIRMGFGTVVAAGSILRRDYKDSKLIIAKTPSGTAMDRTPNVYGGLTRILASNILYLANLVALEQWYVQVRQPFFARREYGSLLYQGALDKLLLARQERIKRLRMMIAKVPASHFKCTCRERGGGRRCDVHDGMAQVYELFDAREADRGSAAARERFLDMLHHHRAGQDADYLRTIKSLPQQAAQEGIRWLESIVDDLCAQAAAAVPSLRLLRKTVPG